MAKEGEDVSGGLVPKTGAWKPDGVLLDSPRREPARTLSGFNKTDEPRLPDSEAITIILEGEALKILRARRDRAAIMAGRDVCSGEAVLWAITEHLFCCGRK